MNRLTTTFAIGLLACSSLCAQQEGCDRPWPVQVPEHAANKDEVLALQTQVKQYLKDAEAYLTCNDAVRQRLAPDAATTSQHMSILTSQYNHTVDEMHIVGEQFNALVREYKKSNQ